MNEHGKSTSGAKISKGPEQSDTNGRRRIRFFYSTIVCLIVAFIYFRGQTEGDFFVKNDQRKETTSTNAASTTFESSIHKFAVSEDLAVLSRGQQIFVTRCAPCHGLEGQGLVGSNLTDDYWIHGSEFKDNLRTIYTGIPEKGMVSWQGILRPGEILAAASYIYTLRGTGPANPKPPENRLPNSISQSSVFE